MDNKTRNIILIGIVGVLAYLVLKPKKALKTTQNSVVPVPIEEEQQETQPIVDNTPIKLKDPIVEKPIPGRTTKDCRITYYSCTSGERSEMIEIPLNANCNDYQEARPNCINELFSVDKKYTPQAKIERGYL
jgi:hypothetical protein